MSFAKRYIDRQITHDAFIKTQASQELSLIVVIPVYNEPDITACLDSLAKCEAPESSVEVILVVNENEKSSQELIDQNQKTIAEVESWKANNKTPIFDTYVIHPQAFRYKHRGVGSARKVGMDEAVRRFDAIDKSSGVIISLDADSYVSENYFVEIEKLFRSKKPPVGCTIKFKHRIEELDSKLQAEGMEIYEMYLHYFKKALEYTGFPHAIYTIGSAFACNVEAYIKQGGMPRRQAGEDFYFLHKLTALGSIEELNSACVYPSARVSNRVPFGTGPSIQNWMDGDDSISYTYNFDAFEELRKFFSNIDEMYLTKEVKEDNSAIYSFLSTEKFSEDIFPELIQNSNKLESFRKRFFAYFNAFKIIKFLNFAHENHYTKEHIQLAHSKLKSATSR